VKNKFYKKFIFFGKATDIKKDLKNFYKEISNYKLNKIQH